MAKEKKEKEQSETINNTSGVEKDIFKKFGIELIDANFLVEEKREIISVSPALDIPLRGGISSGTICTLSGKPGSGKSTTALVIARNAQKKGFKIFYDDVEHRCRASTLQGISGLKFDDDHFKIIRSTKDSILTAESHLGIMLELIKSCERSVFIIDSSSALCGIGEMADEVRSDYRNSSPKLIANFCRHCAPIIALNNSILLITQHLITDTGNGRGGFQEDGGLKLQHASDTRLRVAYTEKWTAGSGENEKAIGQIIHWKIIKSSYGPVDKVDGFLRYGYGIDDISETINLALDLGLLNKGGSWYTLTWLNEPMKLQGTEQVYNYLSSNTEEYEKLHKAVTELLSS